MLPLILVGLVTGSVYSLAGVGLVLTYKTSGVFNFAYGALATISAYILYTLMVEHDVAWGIAVVIAVFVAGPLMGLAFAKLARAVRQSNLVINVGATIGVLLFVEAIVEIIYGSSTYRTVPTFLGSGPVKIFGTNLQWNDVYTFAIGVVATALLAVYLHFARMGIAMRAVVDDSELLDTSGLNPNRVRRVAWIIGCTFAAASGVLFAPLLPLSALQLTLLVVSAYGAAAVGMFRNLPLTFVGGLVIGVGASLATLYFTSGPLAGLAPSLPFLVLFMLLVFYPNRGRSRLPVVADRTARTTSVWRPPATLNLSLGAAVLVLLAFVPQFAGIHVDDWAEALAEAIILLSLSLLVRTSGQVSLCQISFAAIGAAAFSHFAVGFGVPWVLALLLSGAVAIPVGALLAIPSIRLSGIYLALATFGFGILLEYMFYSESYMFGTNGLGLTEPAPYLSFLNLQSDTGIYYVVLICAVLAVGFLVAIDRSRMGRLLRALADAPATLQTSGTTVNVTRVLVFCLSAFLAAIGGALAAMVQSPASSVNYPPLQSLTLFAVIVVIAPGAPWNALIGGVALVLVPAYIHSTTVSYVLQAIFGGSLVLVALLPESKRHLPEQVTGAIDRVFRRPQGRFGLSRPAVTPATLGPLHQTSGGSLELSNVLVRFGGLVAVREVSLEAPAGKITGLIGPNGAGKTTIFNVCSGLIRPNAGQVFLDSRSVTGVGTAARARLGIGRTFQRMELFDSMSVRENVAIGAEACFANGNPLRHLMSSTAQARQIEENTNAALELCGLNDFEGALVSTLPTGRRRLVDLARCLAGEPRMLLLDEPSSGLSAGETLRFAAILRRIRESGVGILIVEHDLLLVLDICSSIYVLDFGEMLFSGTPAEVMASPVVREAYLGEVVEDHEVVEDEFAGPLSPGAASGVL